jgi:feruloyl esterase
MGVDFFGIQDAPTQLTGAKVVASADGVPAFCKVEGYIAPQVGLEVRLPVSNWNGKLIAIGNGGWAGVLDGAWCERHLRRGYACVATDTGHKGTGGDGLWAVNNLPAQIDFGYRSIHVEVLAAKAIADRFYTKPPKKSYFMSCSTGGYQGLVEAQRFPWDFDGIIAGAPDMDEADLTMRQIWIQKAFFDEEGKPILDSNATGILHQAVLAKCGDGAKDGIVRDPIGCSFDPAKLLCEAGKTQGCLSPAQVQAAKRIYDGPPHSPERPIGGARPGSEIMWADPIYGYSTDTGYADSLFKYMIYGASPGWTTATYDFERDYKRLGLAAIYTDTNPDLRRFKASGGKLLIYQGGNDMAEMPGAAVDYYETVEKVMGGRQPTQEFFRLFIVPGMNHCGGGVGAYSIDYLTYLETWVEQNQAPDKMIGVRVKDEYLASLPLPSWLMAQLPPNPTPARRALAATSLLRFPLDPAIPITFSRPMYPYPKYARYASGDPNQASSFQPVEK